MNTQHKPFSCNRKTDRYSSIIFYVITLCVTLLGINLFFWMSPEKAKILHQVSLMMRMHNDKEIYNFIINVVSFFFLVPITIDLTISKAALLIGGSKMLIELKLQRVTEEFTERTALRSLLFSTLYVAGVIAIGEMLDKFYFYELLYMTSLLYVALWVGLSIVYSLILYEGFKFFGCKINIQGFEEMLYVCVFDPIRCIFSKSELLITVLYYLFSSIITVLLITQFDLIKNNLTAYVVVHLYFFVMYRVLASIMVHIESYAYFRRY